MMNNTAGNLASYRSPDKRIRTAYYEKDGVQRFCVSEATKNGALITEFLGSGKVIDQVHYENSPGDAALVKHLGIVVDIEPVMAYERVRIDASCKKCGKEKIGRELDMVNPSLLEKVPVVPLFRCMSCGERFYSMSDEYLAALVNRNEGLFEKDELEEKAKDEKQFISTLNEYIIRIFASKRITKLVIR